MGTEGGRTDQQGKKNEKEESHCVQINIILNSVIKAKCMSVWAGVTVVHEPSLALSVNTAQTISSRKQPRNMFSNTAGLGFQPF